MEDLPVAFLVFLTGSCYNKNVPALSLIILQKNDCINPL
jgi:hypothetical protein